MASRSAFIRKAPVADLRSESATIVSLRAGEVMGANASIKAPFVRRPISAMTVARGPVFV